MAGANTGVDEFDSMVRGLHVYKTVWAPLIDEMLQCIFRKDTNKYDKYTVGKLAVVISMQ